jgi:2-amino-4-hydroxy-6-hydroxymethyldihydropteridine diphosphokinase
LKGDRETGGCCGPWLSRADDEVLKVSGRDAVRVAISIGSNVGDRERLLEHGLGVLGDSLEGFVVSRIYETEPLHFKPQPQFLNACCTGSTRLTARQLLAQLQDAERAVGRTRTGPRYGPRPLDMDLLVYGSEVIEGPELVVPHPRMRQRAFVIVPLAEIAPDLLVPASRGHPAETVGAILRRLSADGVRVVGEAPVEPDSGHLRIQV